jgi:hypothetical protein
MKLTIRPLKTYDMPNSLILDVLNRPKVGTAIPLVPDLWEL